MRLCLSIATLQVYNGVNERKKRLGLQNEHEHEELRGQHPTWGNEREGGREGMRNNQGVWRRNCALSVLAVGRCHMPVAARSAGNVHQMDHAPVHHS